MNNKKIFSLKLYKDALKQLRLFSLITLAFLTIISIMIPIAHYISAKDTLEQNSKVVENIAKTAVNVLESNIFYILLPLVIAPILTIMLFKFLTNRNSSDIYHSIPHTRLCIIVSYIASLITIVFLMITTSTIITAISYSLLSKYVLFSFSHLIAFSINIFITCFLVISVTALACSITGTLFANVSFTAILLFLPRFFIFAFVEITTAALPNAADTTLPLLDQRFNHIFNIIDIVNESSNGLLLKMSFSTIYTTIIGIIFMVLATICFKKRKSETAGNFTNSKRLQIFSTLSLGMAISIFPLAMIFDSWVTRNAGTNDYYYYSSSGASDIFSIITLYLFAIIAMFVYELISSKKIMQAIKSLIYVPVLFVLNVIFILLISFSFNNMLNYTPEVSDLDYARVSICTPTNYYYSELDYFESKVSNIEIKDSRILELLCESNKEFVTSYTDYLNGGDLKYNIYSTYDVFLSDIDWEDEYSLIPEGAKTSFTVTFKDGFFEHQRKVYMSISKYKELIELLSEQEDYVSAYVDLPAPSNTTTYDFQSYGYDFTLDEKEILKIYNALLEDLETINIDDYIKLFYNNNANGVLIITSLIDSNYCWSTIPITPKTPKAYVQMLQSLVNSNNLSISDIDKCIEELKENVPFKDGDYCEIRLDIYDNVSGEEILICNLSKYDNETYGNLTLNSTLLNNLSDISDINNLSDKYTVYVMIDRPYYNGSFYEYSPKYGVFCIDKSKVD